MFFYIHKIKSIYIVSLLMVFTFTSSLAVEPTSVQYRVVKDDTLWSLAKKYLRDPFLWPQIRREDGLNVGEPRLLQIGTLLVIGSDIASDNALDTLPAFSALTGGEKNDSKVQVDVARNEPKQTSPYHFYLVKNGLAYAYYKGQHVTVPVEYLKPKPVDVKTLGSNVHIDKALLDVIFKKDI